MRNFRKNKKGITLISLVITIVILVILSSFATYSGVETIKYSKFTKFITELKIMQTHVNQLYEEYKEEIQKGNTENKILQLGEKIGENVQEQANNVFEASGITNSGGYRYFDNNSIKNDLNIEGVEGEFFINIAERSVVSYKGFEYEGKTYYTLEQEVPNGLYNVEYEPSAE